MNIKKIITWVLFFLILFTTAQFFQKKSAPELVTNPTQQALILTPLKNEYASGQEVIVKIKNNTSEAVTIPSNCPSNPLKVFFWAGDGFEEKNAQTAIDCQLAPDIKIEPNAETSVTFTYWNHSLFGDTGRYKVELPFLSPADQSISASAEFSVVEAGFWRRFFRSIFYQPLYNVLILFISFAPAKDLGFAIILLTLVIRLILLVPSQKAIVSQRKMQEVQPKLDHVKKKYAGNQEKIAQETMKLWKEHKVNPFGSCLPILIQFPVLIALFYVIRNGLNPDNIHLLYDPFKNIDLTNIHTHFIGILELTKVNTFALPLIIGALQFLQMKLAIFKKKQPDGQPQKSEMEMANKMMVYVMPVMIALFTASVPAGVGLYWGVSTTFAIGQQLVANRKK